MLLFTFSFFKLHNTLHDTIVFIFKFDFSKNYVFEIFHVFKCSYSSFILISLQIRHNSVRFLFADIWVHSSLISLTVTILLFRSNMFSSVIGLSSPKSRLIFLKFSDNLFLMNMVLLFLSGSLVHRLQVQCWRSWFASTATEPKSTPVP